MSAGCARTWRGKMLLRMYNAPFATKRALERKSRLLRGRGSLRRRPIPCLRLCLVVRGDARPMIALPTNRPPPIKGRNPDMHACRIICHRLEAMRERTPTRANQFGNVPSSRCLLERAERLGFTP